MNALDVLLLSFAISRSHLHGERRRRPARSSGWSGCRRIDVGRMEMRDFSQTARLLEARLRRRPGGGPQAEALAAAAPSPR